MFGENKVVLKNGKPYLNGKELVEHLYEEAWIHNTTDSEKRAFYERYVRTLSLKVDKDGNFRVEIKK